MESVSEDDLRRIVIVQRLVRRRLARLERQHRRVIRELRERHGFSDQNAVKIQKIVRGFLARKWFRDYAKVSRQRHRIVKEILETERTYVASLTHLVNAFLAPLRAEAAKPRPLVSSKDVAAIFSNIEIILNYNRLLLDELEERVLVEWNRGSAASGLLGDIFLQFCDWLKVYNTYINNYNTSLSTLSACRKSPAFSLFLQECRLNVPQGLDISSMLITPIQRIPRYVMLLKDLDKNTWEGHPDRENLALALERMEDIAAYVNEKKREAENLSRVLEIQDMRVTHMDKDFRLAEPHRRFVMDGPAGQFRDSDKRRQKRHFFLFNDLLLTCKPKDRWAAVGQVYKFKDKIMLANIKTIGESDDIADDVQNCFSIALKDQPGPLVYYMPNKPDRKRWLVALRMAIKEQAQRDRSGSVGAVRKTLATQRSIKTLTVSSADETLALRRQIQERHQEIQGLVSDRISVQQTISALSEERDELKARAIELQDTNSQIMQRLDTMSEERVGMVELLNDYLVKEEAETSGGSGGGESGSGSSGGGGLRARTMSSRDREKDRERDNKVRDLQQEVIALQQANVGLSADNEQLQASLAVQSTRIDHLERQLAKTREERDHIAIEKDEVTKALNDILRKAGLGKE